METIKKDGFEIHFFQKGNINESPILVIGSSKYYPKLFNNDIYKKLNLIYVDHRGFLKPQKHNNFSLEDIVSDIEAVRKYYKIKKFYLLGHSGHGFMAMSYAQKYPNHVKGLILSNLAPTNTEERQQNSIKYFEKYADEDRKAYFNNEIKKLSSDIEKDPSNRFSHMNIRMQAQSFFDFKFDGSYLWKDVFNNLEALDYLWGKSFAKFDTNEFFKSFNKPILLLLSDYDFLVAPTNLWDPIILNTNVQLFKFQKSGHNPMLEEPIKYFELLSNFTKN